MKITKAKYIISSPTLKASPVFNLPEFALIGRSNVGKSSLINAIANNSKLAKTSNVPGKTRLINYFNINDKFIFADLPGYGYAKVSKEIQNDWQKNLENYLLNREDLICLIHLVDARIPLQKNDLQMNEWIRSNNKNCIIAATKTDKISSSKIEKTISDFSKELGFPAFPFSAVNKQINNNFLQALENEIQKYTSREEKIS